MGKITNAKKNKKGVFLTFVAMTIIAVYIIIFTPQADISVQKDAQSVNGRITSIDNYFTDLKSSYFKTVLSATTQKTVSSLVLYMNSTGSFLPNLDSAFKEVMINGTINSVPIDSITGKNIMNNNSLGSWSNRTIQAGKDTLNVNTNIIINDVSVSQTAPWALDSKLDIELWIRSDVAEWRKNVTITSTVSIEGFNDPYYLLNTNGLYATQVKKSSVEFDAWDISKAREHLRNGTYVYWKNPDAPSFLMRFTNTIANSSCCGIESLVNPNKIAQSDQRESYVDYLFWTHKYNPAANCTQIYNITNPATGGGLWDEFRFFKLDISHLTLYSITNRDAVRNC